MLRIYLFIGTEISRCSSAAYESKSVANSVVLVTDEQDGLLGTAVPEDSCPELIGAPTAPGEPTASAAFLPRILRMTRT